MGINNRQHNGQRRSDPRSVADGLVIRSVASIGHRPRRARTEAERLLRERPVPPSLIAAAAESVLADQVHGAVQHGWTPHDLAQIVSRRAGGGHEPSLARLLAEDMDQYAADLVPPAWRAELADLGGPGSGMADARTVAGLARALSLASALFLLPP